MNTKSGTIAKKKVMVVYKHSRYSYAQQQALGDTSNIIFDQNNPLTKKLLLAHEKNQACIDHVVATLQKHHIAHEVICRADLIPKHTSNSFIISVGGDGTLLDVSHQCDDSIILGVNSDPDSSIGALCTANAHNFEELFNDIYQEKLRPIKVARLAINIAEHDIGINALNDVLFCHQNPAAMSRFSLSLNKVSEAFHASGVWVATPAGSTGGIFSAGASALALDAPNALFLQREPAWSQVDSPKLLGGIINPSEKLLITANMSDAAIFIDGPHKVFPVPLGYTVSITLSEQPLWLFDGVKLEENRQKLITQRSAITKQRPGRMSC